MGLTYLLDTNAAIYYLTDSLPEAGMAWLKEVFAQKCHGISVVTRMELLSKEESAEEAEKQTDFVAGSVVFDLSETIILKTIELRKLKQAKKLPDAIVAATALHYDLTLVTRNTADFKNVPGLSVVNPHEI